VIAVVLNWNNLPDTLECVDSTLCCARTLQILPFASWTMLAGRIQLPSFKRDIALSESFLTQEPWANGGGNNSGLSPAIDEGAAYILLLNNDGVVAPDCVRRLVPAAEPHGGYVATPKVFNHDRPTEMYRLDEVSRRLR